MQQSAWMGRPTSGCTRHGPRRCCRARAILLRVAARAGEPRVRWAAMVKRISLTLVVVLLACCAHSPAGKYVGAWGFTSEVIELRPDHTFIYRSWTDDGGITLWARGTWRPLSSSTSRQVETVVVRTESGKGPSVIGLTEHEVWELSLHGIRYGRTPVLRRVRGIPAYFKWPPN